MLASGHQPSDVVVLGAGLTAVIASSVRPLFRWLEFRAFMRMWQEIARRSDMGWIPYFSYAMAAFRSRGRIADSEASVKHGAAGPPIKSESPAIQRYEPASLRGLSWHVVPAGNDKGSVRVAIWGDNILIGDSRYPDGSVLTCSSAEWKMFTEGIRRGDFDELLG